MGNLYSRNKRGKSLVRAVKEDDYDTVQEILSKDVNVNYRDKDKRTSLIYAIIGDHFECAALLLKKGADVNYRDRFGGTCLIYAVRYDPYYVPVLVSLRPDAYSLDNALTEACRIGDDHSVDWLLRGGARSSALSRDDPLILAATEGHFRCVQLLLDPQYSISQSSRDLACCEAISSGNGRCAGTILLAGVSLGAANSLGESPLYLSILRGDLYRAARLIEAGVDVNRKTNYQFTPLMAAVEFGYLQGVKILLAGNAHVNIIGARHCNALQYHLKGRNRVYRNLILLLIAAGEIFDGYMEPKARRCCPLSAQARQKFRRFHVRRTLEFVLDDRFHFYDMKYMFLPGEYLPDINLKDICRTAVRRHMIAVNPHKNLFFRVPHLKVPPELKSYLLHEQRLVTPWPIVNQILAHFPDQSFTNL